MLEVLPDLGWKFLRYNHYDPIIGQPEKFKSINDLLNTLQLYFSTIVSLINFLDYLDEFSSKCKCNEVLEIFGFQIIEFVERKKLLKSKYILGVFERE